MLTRPRYQSALALLLELRCLNPAQWLPLALVERGTLAPRPAPDRRRRPCAPTPAPRSGQRLPAPKNRPRAPGLQVRPVGDKHIPIGLRSKRLRGACRVQAADENPDTSSDHLFVERVDIAGR